MPIMDIKEFRRLGFTSLVSLDEAKAGFFGRVQAIDRVESVPIRSALGRILADTITASFEVPSADKSAMDGYAIMADDSFGATVQKPQILDLAGSIAIGEPAPGHGGQGTAEKIATGATIPAGATAVIKIEDTEIDEATGAVSLYRSVVPGTNIIRRGEDYHAGQEVLVAGRLLQPADLGVIATIGIGTVPVRCQPRVAIIATGNELVDLGTGVDFLPEGKVVDSNLYAIEALATMAGAQVVSTSLLPDEEAKISNALDQLLQAADTVITTGGTSVGERDLLPVVIGSRFEIAYHGLAMKPGSATLLGFGQDKPILCLSGFPVAAEIGMLCFGMPALRKLAGASPIDMRTVVKARLAEAVAVKGFGMTRMLRVAIEQDSTPGSDLPRAIPLKLSGSSIQRSMVESMGFVEIPPDVEGYEAGDAVDVRLHPLPAPTSPCR
jgi:molybdopterin molybdotransferase